MRTSEPIIRDLSVGSGRTLRAHYSAGGQPTVTVALDGVQIAQLRYSEASASNRWAIHISHAGVQPILGLPALAGTVPEDLEGNRALAYAAVDDTLEGVHAWLRTHA